MWLRVALLGSEGLGFSRRNEKGKYIHKNYASVRGVCRALVLDPNFKNDLSLSEELCLA